MAVQGGSLSRIYTYDSHSRIASVSETCSDGWTRTLHTTRDFAGNVTQTTETVTPPSSASSDGEHSIMTCYTRDHRGRIIACSRSVDGYAMAPVSYSYDELGRLSGRTVGDTSMPWVISEALSYDLHGWRTGSTAGTASDPDSLFSQTIRRQDAAAPGASPRWDGTISETASRQGTDEPVQTYAYGYDNAGRLSGARHFRGSSGTESLTDTEKDITYDRNGNITALKRYDGSGLSGDISFTHDGNRLEAMTDVCSSAMTAGATYSYDAAGNLTSDSRKRLLLTYNILNLPRTGISCVN